MDQKLLKIVNHYGLLEQLKYFQSEVFELNEAVILEQYGEDTKEHITEEIADVLVMLEQIRLYYNIFLDDIEKIMTFKINRQLNRIEKEEENKNEKEK